MQDSNLENTLEFQHQGSIELQPGQKIRDYTIVKELGRGGAGIVYLAEDAIGRQVALKTLIKYDQESLKRFTREAEVIFDLNHPNIARLYTFFIERMPCIIMKYIPGTSLLDYLAEKSITKKIKVMIKVAQALEHAHHKGIIHRDIKPDNILVDENGIAYLVDFGIAKNLNNNSLLTTPGRIIGTVVYMSPEQAGGKTIDTRTDIYSFGATLYHILCGQPPFEGPTMQMLFDVVSKHPKLLREIDQRIPQQLESICLKCMAKNPEERYCEVESLIKDLENFSSRKKRVKQDSNMASENARWALLGFIIVVVVGLFSLDIFTEPQARKTAEKHTEKKAQAKSSKKTKQNQKTIDKPINNNWAAAKVSHQTGLNALRTKQYQKAIVHFTRAIEQAPEFSQAYERRGFTYWSLKQYDKAIENHNKAIVLNPNFTLSIYNRGFIYHINKRNAREGIKNYTWALKIDKEYLMAYFYRGQARYQLRDIEGAIADFKQTVIAFNDRKLFRPQGGSPVGVQAIQALGRIGKKAVPAIRQLQSIALPSYIQDMLDRMLSKIGE